MATLDSKLLCESFLVTVPGLDAAILLAGTLSVPHATPSGAAAVSFFLSASLPENVEIV